MDIYKYFHQRQWKTFKIQAINPFLSLKTRGNMISETGGDVFLILHQSIKTY